MSIINRYELNSTNFIIGARMLYGLALNKFWNVNYITQF